MTSDRDSSVAIVMTGGSGFGFLRVHGYIFLNFATVSLPSLGGGGGFTILYGEHWGALDGGLIRPNCAANYSHLSDIVHKDGTCIVNDCGICS